MTTKIYFVRHQAAGIVFQYPFGQPPSSEQVAAVTRECFHLHGASHPKTPEASYWVRVVEFDVLGTDDVPAIPERSLSVANVAGASEFSVSGSGTVEPLTP